MNKKVAFAFTAIAIMLISSVSSVAGSVSEKQVDNAKTIEVPVYIAWSERNKKGVAGK